MAQDPWPRMDEQNVISLLNNSNPWSALAITRTPIPSLKNSAWLESIDWTNLGQLMRRSKTMRLSDHVELNGPTPKASITSVENVTKYHQFSVKYRLLEGIDMIRRANSHCYIFFWNLLLFYWFIDDTPIFHWFFGEILCWRGSIWCGAKSRCSNFFENFIFVLPIFIYPIYMLK